MKEINNYFKGYNEDNKHLNYFRHNLLNEYGPDVDHDNVKYYKEEDIIKTKCK